ncbi:MAG: glycoside hydrolase family 3 N-terminal domain-containing protein [Candidatus Limnocylindrales bacterium]
MRAVLLAIVLIVAACGAPANTTPSAGATPAPTGPDASSDQTLEPACAQQTLDGMTMNQRIGQLFLLGLADNKLGTAELAAIRDDNVGSVWFTLQTSIGADGVLKVTDAVKAEATVAATSSVGFFIGANQEGGQIQALNGGGFSTIPSAVKQGAEDPDALTSDAETWASELVAAGVNLDFAPVSDVVPAGSEATNAPIGALQREYGNDPTTVGDHAAAFAVGLATAGVAATAKHFPGLGRVVGNTDFTAGVIDDVTKRDDPYLTAFKQVIDAGVPFVMVALATYRQIDPAHLAAFSPLIMQDLLRDSLGFQGVIMSDSLTAQAVASMPAGKRAIDFLAAGGDFVIVRSAKEAMAMVSAVRANASSDAAFASRVNDSALRILEAKDEFGLLPCSGG